jgi:hypothetical protein
MILVVGFSKLKVSKFFNGGTKEFFTIILTTPYRSPHIVNKLSLPNFEGAMGLLFLF